FLSTEEDSPLQRPGRWPAPAVAPQVSQHRIVKSAVAIRTRRHNRTDDSLMAAPRPVILANLKVHNFPPQTPRLAAGARGMKSADDQGEPADWLRRRLHVPQLRLVNFFPVDSHVSRRVDADASPVPSRVDDHDADHFTADLDHNCLALPPR